MYDFAIFDRKVDGLINILRCGKSLGPVHQTASQRVINLARLQSRYDLRQIWRGDESSPPGNWQPRTPTKSQKGCIAAMKQVPLELQESPPWCSHHLCLVLYNRGWQYGRQLCKSIYKVTTGHKIHETGCRLAKIDPYWVAMIRRSASDLTRWELVIHYSYVFKKVIPDVKATSFVSPQMEDLSL